MQVVDFPLPVAPATRVWRTRELTSISYVLFCIIPISTILPNVILSPLTGEGLLAKRIAVFTNLTPGTSLLGKDVARLNSFVLIGVLKYWYDFPSICQLS